MNLNMNPSNPEPNPAIASGPTDVNDRMLAVWEIVSIVTTVVIAEWIRPSAAWLSPVLMTVPVAFAVALTISSHRVRGESLRDIGFCFDNFLNALYLLAIPTVVTLGLCLLIAWVTSAPINFLRWQLNANVGWALLQQYMLQGFIHRRAMIVLGRGWRSIVLVAIIFGLLHLPNPWIALITLMAGAIWAAIYQRTPNLFALAVSHSVMTWFVVSTFPPSLLRHMRVGIGYFG